MNMNTDEFPEMMDKLGREPVRKQVDAKAQWNWGDVQPKDVLLYGDKHVGRSSAEGKNRAQSSSRPRTTKKPMFEFDLNSVSPDPNKGYLYKGSLDPLIHGHQWPAFPPSGESTT